MEVDRRYPEEGVLCLGTPENKTEEEVVEAASGKR
jgi:hypothetical protein